MSHYSYLGGGLLGNLGGLGELAGSAISVPAKQPPIRPGEKLELVGWERVPGSPIWLARVVRLETRTKKSTGVEALLPVQAVVKLGLTTQAVVDRLQAQTDQATLKKDMERMARQAKLDRVRHASEVGHNVGAWVKDFWYLPGLNVLFAAIEEVWPGAQADAAEGAVRAICKTPASAIPGYVVGLCDNVQLPGASMIPKHIKVVAGIAVGLVGLALVAKIVTAVRRVA